MNKKEKILEILKKYKVALAYLFGSQKDDAFRFLNGEKIEINDPLADIDLGIVFTYPIEEVKERYKLYGEIYNEIEEIFKPFHLDLVFLQECHSVFQAEAIKGICIYAISEEFKDNYEMMILRRYADFKYELDKFFEEALEK
jgi:predicted nucleotidyltransferase